MKIRKTLACTCMAAAVAGSYAVSPIGMYPYGITAWAAGPGTEGQIPEGYDEETWSKLQDNVMEYDELMNLVKEYNPVMKSVNQAYEGMIDDTNNQARLAYDAAREAKEDAEEIKNSGGLETEAGQILYGTHMATNKMMSSIGDQSSRSAKMLAKTTSSAYRNSVESALKPLTSFAQFSMTGYHAAVSQRTTLEKMKEMYTAMYDSAVLQLQLGTVTQADVTAAQTNLLSAEASLLSLNHTIDQLRSTLCLLTGWAADATPEIGPIPPADVTRVESINLEADTAKAIGNNPAVISQRHAGANSTTGKDNKQRLEAEAEQKVTVAMQSLHQDVLQKKAEYDSAQLALESATMLRAAADRQYQLGMVSKNQYLGQQLSYLQAEGAMNAADIALFQILLTYDQAVDGTLDIE